MLALLSMMSRIEKMQWRDQTRWSREIGQDVVVRSNQHVGMSVVISSYNTSCYMHKKMMKGYSTDIIEDCDQPCDHVYKLIDSEVHMDD